MVWWRAARVLVSPKNQARMKGFQVKGGTRRHPGQSDHASPPFYNPLRVVAVVFLLIKPPLISLCLRSPASPLAWCRMSPCARSHSCKRSRSEWRAVRRRRKRTPPRSSSLRSWRRLCSWGWMRRSSRTRCLTWACMACSRSPWVSRSTLSSSRLTRPTIRQAAALTRSPRGLPLYYGVRAPASCVLCAPEAQGSLPRGPKHGSYAVHVPASGVPSHTAYSPRTVWCTTGGRLDEARGRGQGGGRPLELQEEHGVQPH